MNTSKVWRRIATANDASASFTAPAASETTPTTNVIAPIEGDTLELIPFGIGADNTTFDMRVIGWSKVDTLWTPKVITHISCTLSASVGVAGTAVLNTERFVDTIAANKGIAVIPTVPVDTPETVIVDLTGYQLINFDFDMTGATSGNALWRTTE